MPGVGTGVSVTEQPDPSETLKRQSLRISTSEWQRQSSELRTPNRAENKTQEAQPSMPCSVLKPHRKVGAARGKTPTPADTEQRSSEVLT